MADVPSCPELPLCHSSPFISSMSITKKSEEKNHAHNSELSLYQRSGLRNQNCHIGKSASALKGLEWRCCAMILQSKCFNIFGNDRIIWLQNKWHAKRRGVRERQRGVGWKGLVLQLFNMPHFPTPSRPMFYLTNCKNVQKDGVTVYQGQELLSIATYICNYSLDWCSVISKNSLEMNITIARF